VCGRVPVLATSSGGGLRGVGHSWSEMLLFVRSALFLWHGPLGSGAGAVEASAADASSGDWPCSIRCTFHEVSRFSLGPLP